MAQESFENEKIASLLNQDYIAIKVDREELPQVDSYYQQLYFKLKHRTGGWPLTIILDENRKPFFLAGYLPPQNKYGIEGLTSMLPRLAKRYREAYPSIQKDIRHIEVIQKRAEPTTKEAIDFSLERLMQAYEKHFDPLYYGFSKQPKFPEAARIGLLLDLGQLGYAQANTMALHMLRAMALHGLYDQVEGGFFRYSTDAAWEIPHFEKMLYNQAELIPLYTKAYTLSKEALFKSVVEESISMTKQRFGVHGLFFSASNADTHHEEGAYFLFSEAEINASLQKNPYAERLNEAMEYDGFMNFKGQLHLNFYTQQRPQGFKAFRASLQQIRKQKEYPFVDQKIITAWNAMMIKALYRAGTLDKKYITSADNSLKALLGLMYKNGQLYHQTLYKRLPKQKALLEDYAFLISALIGGYEASYDISKLHLADTLMQQALFLFYRDGKWIQADDALKVEVDLRDKYYTSSFGIMMQDLLKLAALTENRGYAEVAKKSLTLKRNEIVRKEDRVPSSTTAMLMQKYGVVVLKHRAKVLEKERQNIAFIKYPFLVTKGQENTKSYLACTIDRCFAYDKQLESMKTKIEAFVK